MAQGSRLPGPPASPQGLAPGLHSTSSRSELAIPRFKGKKRDPLRFRIPQRVTVKDGKVYVPKIGWVRIRQSQPIEGITKSATFRRDACGHWYVTLVVELEMPDVTLPAPDPAKVAGIDLGLKVFATITGRKPVPNPRFFRTGQRRLKRAQRAVSRRKDDSRRKAKARRRVARIHCKIANQRKDFLHKLTTELVVEHDGLCIEDLSIKGLARTKLAISFADAAMGEFRRQLKYKSEWNRKHLDGDRSLVSLVPLVPRLWGRQRRVDALGSALGLCLRDGPRSRRVRRNQYSGRRVEDLGRGAHGQVKRSGRDRKTSEGGTSR